ncbi:MAG: energy transducer TonB [Spirochaetales bacterium]|nr:energy transducer TonB [Spirochaetales bacterium]
MIDAVYARKWFIAHRYVVVMLAVAIFHLAALVFIRFGLGETMSEPLTDYRVLKLVDIEEYAPPPPAVETTMVYNQPTASEQIVTTEDQVIEVDDPSALIAAEPDYLPQHKISVIPEIPTKEILGKIRYPSLALRQQIEGVVYLELYIDQTGLVRKIQVLKDPGFGFAESAVEALTGVRCKPAIANGQPVAVRFRYPVRFTLQQ